MKHYLDIHSHTPSPDPEVWTLHSLYEDFSRIKSLAECSIGLHPWHLNGFEGKMKTLKKFAAHPHVLAIGECGLDRASATAWNIQTDVFSQHIELANQLGKPLIIHCVRAYAEAISMLKNARVPVIFHGFQKKPALARELTGHGFYLSFGAVLTEFNKHAIDSFMSTPKDRFFLETDDSDLPIQTIYQMAASIRSVSEDALIKQIHKNYQTVFNK